MFVCVLVKQRVKRRKRNREGFFSWRWAVCLISHVWPIKTRSCFLPHLSEAALLYRLSGFEVSASRWIAQPLICSDQLSGCCLIYLHPSAVLILVFVLESYQGSLDNRASVQTGDLSWRECRLSSRGREYWKHKPFSEVKAELRGNERKTVFSVTGNPEEIRSGWFEA